MSRPQLLLLCAALIPTALAGTPPKAAPLTPLRGAVISGGWRVTWSEKDAVAVRLRGTERLTLYSNGRNEWPASESAFGSPGYSEADSRVLSIVGPIVSFKVRYEGSGGMHPIYGEYIRAVDLDDAGEDADVLQLFEEAPLVLALRRVPMLAARLEARRPSDLDELLKDLGESCDADFQSLPRSFAVLSVSGRRAVVRFGLGHGCEVNRGRYTEFDVSVPFHRERRKDFTAASQRGSLLYSFRPE